MNNSLTDIIKIFETISLINYYLFCWLYAAWSLSIGAGEWSFFNRFSMFSALDWCKVCWRLCRDAAWRDCRTAAECSCALRLNSATLELRGSAAEREANPEGDPWTAAKEAAKEGVWLVSDPRDTELFREAARDGDCEANDAAREGDWEAREAKVGDPAEAKDDRGPVVKNIFYYIFILQLIYF